MIKQDPEATYNVNAGLLLLQQAPREEVNNLNIFLSNPHWDEDMRREAEEALMEDDPLPLVTGQNDDDSEDSKKNLKEKLGRFIHNRSASATANRTHSSEYALGIDATQPVDSKATAEELEKMEEYENENEDEDDSLLEQNDDDQNDDHNVDQNNDQNDDLNEEEEEHL